MIETDGEGARMLELHIQVDSKEELAELERVILKAQATELAEIRRQNLRFTAGYGDVTSRDVMSEEGRRASLRHAILTKLLDEIRRQAGS